MLYELGNPLTETACGHNPGSVGWQLRDIKVNSRLKPHTTTGMILSGLNEDFLVEYEDEGEVKELREKGSF